jgi:hypothetical protein
VSIPAMASSLRQRLHHRFLEVEIQNVSSANGNIFDATETTTTTTTTTTTLTNTSVVSPTLAPPSPSPSTATTTTPPNAPVTTAIFHQYSRVDTIVACILVVLIVLLAINLVVLIYKPIRRYIRRRYRSLDHVQQKRKERRYRTIDQWLVTKVSELVSDL